MRRLVLLLACLFACGPRSDRHAAPPDSARTAATLAFEDVAVFDGERSIARTTVLVAGDRIVAIGPDLPIPEAAERISGEGATLLPGLVDAHTHAQFPAQLEQALAFGVTTEIDMFTSPELAASMRAQQAAGEATGRADLVSAGILVTAPGGHGTEYGVAIPTLSNAAEAAAFVDARLAEGSDFIKIVYDDGSAYGARIPTLDRSTLQAVIDAAHARGVLAVVHVSSQREAIDAVAAGADGLAHLFFDEPAGDAFVAAAEDRGIFVTDTLAVLSSACDGTRGRALGDDEALRPFLAPADRTALHESFPLGDRPSCEPALQTASRLHAAGVRLLASTDAPNPGTIHGATLHDELALLVRAGLSAEAALRAATADPADVFGLSDRGRIAVGKRADLVLVAGDPTRDITRTRAILGVWKQGTRFDRDAVADRVRQQWAELDRMRQAPAPAGLAAGLIADFDSGELRSEFGAGFQPSTDGLRGGASTVELSVVDGALHLEGTIDAASLPAAWAGAMFFPGAHAMAPANLGDKPVLVFRARGQGPLAVLVFAQQLGMQPAMTTVELGPEWTEHRVDLRTLVAEPYDVTGLFFGGPPRAGAFAIEIDDLRLQ